MSDQMILELEAAARIIMAPPNMVTNEERKSAETIFMNFRRSKSPYPICRQILENSKVDYVQFEAAEVIKKALIREWSFLQQSDKMSLRHYLMHYISSRDVPFFVRDRILQVICIMVKRASVDDNGRETTNVLNEVENLIINGEHPKKILGCLLIYNLMQEYANTVVSTDVGLSWEVHLKAKKQFEADNLERIFKFCVLLLSKIVQNDSPFEQNVAELLENILKIAEYILSWGFISVLLPKRLIGVFEYVYKADETPALRLGTSWEEIMFAPQFLPLMFQVYWKVRYSDQISHLALTCLVQLASLNGAIMSGDAVRLQYLSSYMENFAKLVSSVTIKNKESLGISNIIRKLTLFFNKDLTKIDQALQFTYLDELTRLTCTFCEGAAVEESNSDDEKYFNEAFDNMLEAWMTILQEYVEDFNVLSEYATKVFNTYLQCHLGPPEGSRRHNDSEVEDIEDNEDNDRIKYKDQLQTIGMFGRVILQHSLPILYKLLESGMEKLKSHLHGMQNRAMTISEASALEGIFEDLHWTLLIAGHVLCMDSDGEIPLIPSDIMHYSMKQISNQQSNLDATLKVLATAHQVAIQPEALDQCDQVIRIFADVLRLSVLEGMAADVKLGHFMSPEVSCTVMWFLKRWCLSYLLPDENFYLEISPTIIGAVGKDTEGANFVLNFILGKIQSNLSHFTSEPVLLRDTAELFSDIVCVKQKAVHIIKTEGFWNLINVQTKLQAGSLPPGIRTGIYKGFVLAGTALQDPVEMNNYYEQLLKPLQVKFKALVSQENFTRVFHEEKMQGEIVDLLECFTGLTKGAQLSNVQILFDFLSPILSELPALLNVYANIQVVVQLILELFGQCAKNMLCFLNAADTKKMYDYTFSIVQVYTKCNSNRFTCETFAEESSFQDLALVLSLLTAILSKDCIDLCPTVEEVEVTTASEVSLVCLNFVMPLMSRELLKYPTLCTLYYRLLVIINDMYPEKICALPGDLQGQLLQSIRIGLTDFGADVSQMCIDFIQGMAGYLYLHQAQHFEFYSALRPFLALVLDLCLTNQISSDTTTCIYSLICCYYDEYQNLIQSLIQSQTDPLIADRLSAAFVNLNTNVEFNGHRRHKLKFRDNFDKFIVNVQGFLLIK